MARFEFEDFDPYGVAEPHEKRRFGGTSLCAGCKHAHLYRRRMDKSLHNGQVA